MGWRRRADVRARLAAAAGALDSDPESAERTYRQLVQEEPELEAAWFDLGLIYKRRRDWQRSFECNRWAAELVGERADEPAWWNLGIAATALRDWETARRAWDAYGVDLPPGSGRIEADLGPAPVRLNPDGHSEVVWGRRVDPARVVVMSIPFPASGHQWGDYVLHDGVPNGEREWHGRTYCVFDELERWEPSGAPTLQADIVLAGEDDLDALSDAVWRAGFAAEDWSANVRLLCRSCSEGRVDHHDHGESESGRERRLGLAGDPAQLRSLLGAWAASVPGRQCHLIDEG